MRMLGDGGAVDPGDADVAALVGDDLIGRIALEHALAACVV